MAEEWFYTNDGQQMGPVSIAGLRELAARGGLQPSDLVWTEGMSTWVPANATRGLFPSTAPRPPAPAHVPEVKAASPQRLADDRPMVRFHDRRFDRRSAPAGMSTGTKVLIGLGIAGVLGMALMVGVLMIVSVISETSAQQRYQQGVRGRPMFGGPPPVAMREPGIPINPIPPPVNLKVVPAGQKSYVVNLTAVNTTDGRLLAFTKGQKVTITVTTEPWVIDEQTGRIDVDLYVYDSKGVLIAFDDEEPKDCRVTFTAERTENYTVVVHLCDGASATCKVEY